MYIPAVWYHRSHMETNEMNQKHLPVENSESKDKLLPAAVLIAGVLIAGAVIWNGSGQTVTGDVPGIGATPKVNIKDVKIDGNPFIGRANAPVTMAVWDDFQCPYCQKFKLETLPEIVKNYVDTGKVKIVFMDFPFQGEDSITGALYSHAIWKLYPEKYHAWNTAMFTAQDAGGNQGFGDPASIDKLNATIAGIDAAKVAADVKANTSVYQKMVDDSKAEGQKAGINATPSFIIDTQMIQGAYPYADFKAAIDAALK